jgi:phosphoglycolate phosphatase-like HAD superfamily hydrolase
MYDCALFDIDGVLVDIRKSYNAAIKKTVAFVISELGGRTFRNLVTDQIILEFRQTGGFNNDTDTCYAITLAMLASPQNNVTAARRFLAKVAANADETGITSVEKFLARFGIEKWKDKLAYPAPVKDSMLARVFDELFYGPELFRKQNNLEPKYSRGGKPLIKNDKLVVSKQTMKRLDMMFSGKLAIVSGRSRLAADYSLGPVMKYFDLGASVFLEDERREYAKPNTFAIKHAMEAMNARTAAYAGDSAEDLLMARRAEKELGVKIDFVGVYGFSVEPKKVSARFRKEGVVLIATVNQLPRTLQARL